MRETDDSAKDRRRFRVRCWRSTLPWQEQKWHSLATWGSMWTSAREEHGQVSRNRAAGAATRTQRDRVLSPRYIVSMEWVGSPTELCNQRLTVTKCLSPNGFMQRRLCQCFGHTQRNCTYACRCVARGETNQTSQRDNSGQRVAFDRVAGFDNKQQ
jgi:hypothetical protein